MNIYIICYPIAEISCTVQTGTIKVIKKEFTLNNSNKVGDGLLNVITLGQRQTDNQIIAISL
jgi:hypothetical protein